MLDNYRDLIDELLETPTIIREALAAGTPVATLAPLVGELRDRDTLVMERVQRMTHQPNAHLKALPTTGATTGAGEDPDAVLTAFETARGELVSLLMNLTLKDWEKRATHDTLGEISVADEVETHVEFDEAHVARIEALST